MYLRFCVCETDNDGHVIDLVKDQLPEMQLSEQDLQKNLELLEEAKKVSDRFLSRRGRRSTCSLTDSPTGTRGSDHTPLQAITLQTEALNTALRVIKCKNTGIYSLHVCIRCKNITKQIITAAINSHFLTSRSEKSTSSDQSYLLRPQCLILMVSTFAFHLQGCLDCRLESQSALSLLTNTRGLP